MCLIRFYLKILVIIDRIIGMGKFLSICLSSTIQRTVNFKKIALENVNRSESYILDASGKAVNSARVLNQLEPGCVTVICPLGKENKSVFIELAENDGLNVVAVEIPGKIRECWTLLDHSCGTTTELVVGEPVLSEDYKKYEEILLSLIRQNLNDYDGIILAGSKPGYFSDGLVACIARLAVDSGKIFLADYCGKDLILTLELCTPSIIKINEDEFCRTFNLSGFIDKEQLKRAVAAKSLELNNVIIVTRGKKSTIAAKNGGLYEFPTEEVAAVNTTACGDSFSAGFLYEYVNTGDFETSLAKGTWCASRNAESMRPGSIIKDYGLGEDSAVFAQPSN
jgi:fructose-1-phosphate kinase PfkB-like protein